MNEEAQTMLVEALTVLVLAIAKAIHYRYLRRKGYTRTESLRPWNPESPPSEDHREKARRSWEDWTPTEIQRETRDDAEPTPPQTPDAKKRNRRGPLV